MRDLFNLYKTVEGSQEYRKAVYKLFVRTEIRAGAKSLEKSTREVVAGWDEQGLTRKEKIELLQEMRQMATGPYDKVIEELTK